VWCVLIMNVDSVFRHKNVPLQAKYGGLQRLMRLYTFLPQASLAGSPCHRTEENIKFTRWLRLLTKGKRLVQARHPTCLTNVGCNLASRNNRAAWQRGCLQTTGTSNRVILATSYRPGTYFYLMFIFNLLVFWPAGFGTPCQSICAA
jgi:hypothetical protein